MNKVLVVDDEFIIRKGIKKMVEKFPNRQLDVHIASNGLEALSAIEEHGIQVVLTDIRMPKMDGLDLCKEINKQYNDIHTVIISGYDDFDYAKQAIRFGVRDYLLKPVLPNDIHKILDTFISESQSNKYQVTLSALEAWMDSIEEALWNLKTDEIPKILTKWDELCRKSGMRNDELAGLLRDSLASIHKRMARKSFNSQGVLPENLETLNTNEMLKHFTKQIMSIVDQLSLMRNANYRNPFEEAKLFIDQNLAEDITLDETAQHVGISPTYFSQLFKKETNETFVQYRIRKRMQKAKELMEIPHYRLIDICLDVGYNDYPHFTKTFKKYYGISPSEYRASIGIE